MKQFSVAMLGFGIAGKAFSRILIEKHQEIMEKTGYDVQVTAITTGSRGTLICPQGIDLQEATRQVEELGHFDVSGPWYSEMNTMEVVEKADYDVVLELTPINIRTGQPAIDHIKGAMNRGKHAITANKGPIAWAYRELRDLAKEKGVCFYYETTVMAGTPVFNMADNCLQYCKISEVKGILNATTNYVLEEMTKGVPMDVIMENGRRGGFMEADASMDMKGWDAAAKLTALLNVLMDAGITPDQIDRTGIEEVTAEDIQRAAEHGCKVKLLCKGKIEDGKVVGIVKPSEIKADDAFAGSDVVAVGSIDTDLMGRLTMVQYGLETTQTGYGVFIDLIRVLENCQAIE